MNPKIIVVYRADGSVERYPVNVAGSQCQAATKPYTDLDAAHGAVTDTPTADALLPEPVSIPVDIKV